MSNQYKYGDRVPTDVLARRLDELSRAVTDGKEAVSLEFTMRIPAELDRDADLVLQESAKRLRELESLAQSVVAYRELEPVDDALVMDLDLAIDELSKAIDGIPVTKCTFATWGQSCVTEFDSVSAAIRWLETCYEKGFLIPCSLTSNANGANVIYNEHELIEMIRERQE